MHWSNTFKGVSTIISTLFMHLILGNVYTWGNINTYYISYLQLYNKDITILDIYFMSPVVLVFLNVIPIIAEYIERWIGVRLITLLALILIMSSNVLWYYFHTYLIIMTAMVLFGIGDGLLYFPLVRVCWKYFPSKRGWITGLIFCTFGMSSFVFTSLADFIINPDGEEAHDGVFEEKIALRVKTFLFIVIICMAVLGFLGFILQFPYQQEEKSDELNDEEKEKTWVDNTKVKDEKENVDQDIPNATDDETVKGAVFSSQYQIITIMTWCTLFFPFMITNTSRNFGSKNQWDEQLLQIQSKVFAVLNGVFRLSWGAIYDRTGLFYPYWIVCINQILVSGLFFFAGKNEITYFVINCLVTISFSGHVTMFPNWVSKKFGVKNSVVLLGIIGIYSGWAGILGPIWAKIVIHEWHDYWIVYSIGCGWTIVSWVLLFFVKEERFVFPATKDLVAENKTIEKLNGERLYNDSNAEISDKVDVSVEKGI